MNLRFKLLMALALVYSARGSLVAAADTRPGDPTGAISLRYSCDVGQESPVKDIHHIEYEVGFSAGFFEDGDGPSAMKSKIVLNGKEQTVLSDYVSGGDSLEVVVNLGSGGLGIAFSLDQQVLQRTQGKAVAKILSSGQAVGQMECTVTEK